VRRARAIEAALLALAALALPGAGCGLFDVRDAVEGGGEDSVWVPPTSPEIVVANLEAALEAGIFGDYLRAFTEDFAFVPDAADVVQLSIERPGEPVFEGWTREVETQVAEAIETGAESLELALVFLSEQILDEGRLHKYSYVLTLQRGGEVDVHQGEAWLEIRQVTGGEWLIHAWQDVITPETVESWGRLKGRNRQL
jgi:hypothetical protein